MFTTPRLGFRLRFNGDDENGGKPAAKPEDDLGFPADTRPEDMTPEQQLAFYKNDAEKWKGLSRKHEKRARPENFDEIAADAQKWREKEHEDLPPDEKAVNAARTAGRREGATAFLHDAVRAELKARRPHMTNDELDEFLEDVALDKFLGQDERLDTERVERLAGKLADAPKQDGDTPPAPDPAPGGAALGDVLRRTTAPPKDHAGSVAEYRNRERERYTAQNSK